MKVAIYRMIKDIKVFSKGQKVFEVCGTGALACLARGRYKKKGRWVSAWVHWADKEDGKGFNHTPTCRFIGYANLDEKFLKHIGLDNYLRP